MKSENLTLRGFPLRVTDSAVKAVKTVTITPNPVKKRRRNWNMKVEVVEEPTVYLIANPAVGTMIVIHPYIYEKLKNANEQHTASTD